MSEVSVRRATVDDLDGLAQALAHLHDDCAWTADREPEAQATLKAIVDDPSRGLTVAVVDGRVVGTIDIVVCRNLTRDLRPFALIENVVVMPDFRRRGIGRLLMSSAIGLAEEQGCYKVQLVSSNKRDAAHELYEAMGFDAPVSGYRRYLTDVGA
jgi:GNAT superfamily N-acetyltransferase